MAGRTFKAVIWDFGGVITTSPFEAFNRYEESYGLPIDFIRTINATNPETNAWAQFESSAVSLDEFDKEIAKTYYSTCRRCVKAVAPEKLYLGSRLTFHYYPDDLTGEWVIRTAAKYCDVIGFNVTNI